jgi:hypothetical protein
VEHGFAAETSPGKRKRRRRRRRSLFLRPVAARATSMNRRRKDCRFRLVLRGFEGGRAFAFLRKRRMRMTMEMMMEMVEIHQPMDALGMAGSQHAQGPLAEKLAHTRILKTRKIPPLVQILNGMTKEIFRGQVVSVGVLVLHHNRFSNTLSLD